MKKFLLYTTYFLVLFSYIYGLAFSAFPIGMGKVAVAVAIGIIIYRGHIKKFEKSFLKANLWYYFSQVYLLVYLFIIIVVSNSTERYLPYVIFLRLTEFIIGAFAVVYLGHNIFRIKSDRILLLIAMVIFLQAIFVYISFVSWGFKMFVDALLPVTGNIDSLRLDRVRGFSNTSGAAMSAIQGIGASISFYLAMFRYKGAKSLALFVISVLTGLSTVVMARTGLILWLMTISATSIMVMLSNVNISLKLLYRIAISLFVSGIVLYFCYFSLIPKDKRAFFERTVMPWAFELFMNENMESKTGNELKENHFFLPKRLKTLLWGDGVFTNDAVFAMGHKARSDSGYVRMIFAVGLIGAFLLIYLPLLLLVLKSIKFTPASKYKKFIISVTGVMFFLELKEPFLILSPTYPMFLVFIYIPILQGISEVKKNNGKVMENSITASYAKRNS